MKNKIIAKNGVDLHTHSNVSDGTMTPSELAVHAYQNGIKVIALTDHDTTAGIDEFMQKCIQIGIEGIPGIEIGAKYKSEMHILGLYIDKDEPVFAEKVNILSNSRRIRNIEMLDIFQKAGFDIKQEDILYGKEDIGLCGRAHFAAALVRKGYAFDFDDAFEKYIGKGKPFYVKRKTFSPKESIELIKKAGGIAILAHPMYITKDKNQLKPLLEELKSYGLDGVESMYSQYDKTFSKLCFELCGELGLIPTGGSDFHAQNKPHIPIGIVNGGMMVPYEIAQNLKKYHQSGNN